jgi:hypothetical protein
MIKDKNGKDIKKGCKLNVPLEVFSNDIVTENDKGYLCLELRYEGKKIMIKDMNQNILEIID